MQMINDYVGIVVEEEKESASGLVKPDGSKSDRPQIGIVRYNDHDIYHYVQSNSKTTTRLPIGKKVIFGGWYDPVEIEGEEVYFVKFEDIKAILDGSK